MNALYPDLYQFTVYLPPLDFTIHQYLLAAETSVLFATGAMKQAQAILPQVQELLAGRPLRYIFVSHMESDECGGLSALLRAYPDARVICSALAARELPGYGIECHALPVSGGMRVTDGALDLEIFDCPAEVHLQNGIVGLEHGSGVFYSADLMQRFGNGGGQCMQASWAQEVDAIRLPDANRTDALKQALRSVSPRFVAVGHGFCIQCEP